MKGFPMIETIIDLCIDTIVDSAKLIPFLFLTYLAMDYVEHKAADSMKRMILRAGKSGPALGSILGIIPQCGFSAAATSLYAGRIITIGTLLAIYLSTSDEMLPIMISEQVDAVTIGKILFIKVIVALLAGFLIDSLFGAKLHIHAKHREDIRIARLCEDDRCQCEEKSIVWSALTHTLEIAVYILIFSFIIHLLVEFVGIERLSGTALNMPVIGELLAGLIGLIPNCAASVAITQLYLEGAIGLGSLMAGLLVGAGVGLLVLFRVNHDRKENLKIVAILYVTGVVAGMLVSLLPL